MVTQQHPERHRSAVHGRMTEPAPRARRPRPAGAGPARTPPASASAARVPNRCQRLEPPMRPTQLASRVVSASIAVRSPTNHRASMRHRHAHISTSARPVDVPRSAIRPARRPSSSMSSGRSSRKLPRGERLDEEDVSPSASAARMASLCANASAQRPQYTAACVRRAIRRTRVSSSRTGAASASVHHWYTSPSHEDSPTGSRVVAASANNSAEPERRATSTADRAAARAAQGPRRQRLEQPRGSVSEPDPPDRQWPPQQPTGVARSARDLDQVQTRTLPRTAGGGRPVPPTPGALRTPGGHPHPRTNPHRPRVR